MYSLYTAGIVSPSHLNVVAGRSPGSAALGKARSGPRSQEYDPLVGDQPPKARLKAVPAFGASLPYPCRLMPALLDNEVRKKNFLDLAALQ